MLGADGKADGRRGDALIEQLFLGQLGMRRGCRMDDQRLHVRDVCQQRENLQIVNEPKCGFLPALDFEREDARAAVREVALVERVVGMVGQGRMVDLLDLRMVFQEFDDLLRIFCVPLEAQRQRLRALQQQEGIERRERSALIAQDQRADVRRKSCRADILGKADAAGNRKTGN